MSEAAPTTPTASGSARSSKIVWILLGAILVFAVVFGAVTVRSRQAFDAYKEATLADPASPPVWEREALDIEACVDEVLTWGLECPSIQSWCLGSVPGVLHSCLDSQPRQAACAAYGDEISATRFGYDACAGRYGEIEEKYRKRATKKYCATIYRSLADYCANGAG